MKKCGLLLADMQSGKVIEAGVASVNKFSDLVSRWTDDHEIIKIIIGNGTNCRYIENKLKRNNFFNINYVNERGSTLRARFRYWKFGLQIILFVGFQKKFFFTLNNLFSYILQLK